MHAGMHAAFLSLPSSALCCALRPHMLLYCAGDHACSGHTFAEHVRPFHQCCGVEGLGRSLDTFSRPLALKPLLCSFKCAWRKPPFFNGPHGAAEGYSKGPQTPPGLHSPWAWIGLQQQCNAGCPATSG